MAPEPTSPPVTRRRFLAIVGAIAGAGLGATGALSAAGRAGAAPPVPVTWRGAVLGAEASITLYHPDPAAAESLIAGCVDEIARLERIFSLFRRDSALVRLNREGRLAAAPPELVELLRVAQRVSAVSEGAFDATVQPLWTLYAGHFARADADPDGPPAAAVAAARARVDWRGLTVTGGMVALARPGMAVTLNGIAQGFVTDRVAQRLRAAGIGRVLLDLGEFRGIGRHPDGRPWRVGMADPRNPATVLRVLEASDRAVASSGGYGTIFDRAGRFHHLFDPATGLPAQVWAGVTVVADDATTADALSTALCVAPPERAAAILRAGGGRTAWLVSPDGRVQTIEA